MDMHVRAQAELVRAHDPFSQWTDQAQPLQQSQVNHMWLLTGGSVV